MAESAQDLTDGRPPDRRDLDVLLNFLLDFAQQTLRRYGGLYPFGAVLTLAGDVVGQAGKLVETDTPPPRAIIDLITDGMKSQARDGTIRASGLCYDATSVLDDGSPTDAIAFRLEHQSGHAVLVTQPYSKRRVRGYAFEDLVAQPAEPQIFVRA